MQDLFSIPEENLPMTVRSIRKEILKRGWTKARYIFSTFSFLELTRPDGKTIIINSSTPPTSSAPSCMLATDKYASYQLMKDLSNVSQPETARLSNSQKDRQETISRFLEKYKKIVIKPIDGAHGNNVFTDVSSLKEADHIISHLMDEIAPESILIQEQLLSGGKEMRVLCINYQYVAAYRRIPASVTGDGEHTVSQLIDIENRTIRTAPYKGILNYIDKNAAEEYFSKNPIENDIPKKGQKVQVVGICNAGKGGSMEDITDTLPEKFRRSAEDIAKRFSLPVVGVDFYEDKVIEINSGPALYYPDVSIKKYIDYLETI